MTEMMMILVTLVVWLALMAFRRGKPAENKQDFAELRGQLSQITTQSQELQRLIAEQMAQSEGRLSNRLEASLRDQGERTTKSLTGMAEKLRSSPRLTPIFPQHLSGRPTSECAVKQAGTRKLW